MKNLIIILAGFVSVISCSNPKKDIDFKKEFENKIDQFEAVDINKIESFIEKLDRIQTKINIDRNKTKDVESDINLDFDKNNIFQLYFNYWHDTTSLGKNNKHFSDERKISSLIKATKDIDSYKNGFGYQSKSSQFDKERDFVMNKISNCKYVVILSTEKNIAPTWYGATFKQGTYTGKVLVYDINNYNLLASVRFDAINSTSVSSTNFNNLGDAAMADFKKQINKAFVTCLKDNFSVKGEPSVL